MRAASGHELAGPLKAARRRFEGGSLQDFRLGTLTRLCDALGLAALGHEDITMQGLASCSAISWMV